MVYQPNNKSQAKLPEICDRHKREAVRSSELILPWVPATPKIDATNHALCRLFAIAIGVEPKLKKTRETTKENAEGEEEDKAAAEEVHRY